MKPCKICIAIAMFYLVIGRLAPVLDTYAEQSLEGKVIGVMDGDTIEILENNTPKRVRLYGVDCPERGQPFSKQAKQFTSELVYGKIVVVQLRTKDRYSRLIGSVSTQSGINVSRELVRAGLAWWYEYFAPSEAELQSLQNEARQAKQGIWSQPNPVPPWEFRRSKRGDK